MPSSISRRKLIKKFKALGYSGPFSGKKHQFMKKGTQKIRIPNPHGSQDISVDLVKEILKQAGIPNDEWDRL
ncbi:MAG: type II toxin-antitoxin system HicA family toxin [Microcystaceae cyanobacterium]